MELAARLWLNSGDTLVAASLQDIKHVGMLFPWFSNVFNSGRRSPKALRAVRSAPAVRSIVVCIALVRLHRYAYRAVGEALEVIPRSLAHNCGAALSCSKTSDSKNHSKLAKDCNFSDLSCWFDVGLSC